MFAFFGADNRIALNLYRFRSTSESNQLHVFMGGAVSNQWKFSVDVAYCRRLMDPSLLHCVSSIMQHARD
jgi:hypothetical protein